MDNEGNLTTTTTSTTTTTTTTITRSRQPSPSPPTVRESGYVSEQSSSNPSTSLPNTLPTVPPPPPQQRLPGPDISNPPNSVHPAFRNLSPHEQRQAEEQTRRDGYNKGKDPLVTIRESRALSDKASISSRATSADPHTRHGMLGDFKAATAGLYDVRDSFRGMASAEQTRYYSRKQPSARDLKNQGSSPQIRDPPPRPDWNGSEPPSEGSVMGDSTRQPSQQLNYSSSNSTMGQGSEEYRSRRKSLGAVPATFSPESTGTAQEEHKSALRKLLKGRH